MLHYIQLQIMSDPDISLWKERERQENDGDGEEKQFQL